MVRTALFLAFLSTVSQPAADPTSLLEKKLHGKWYGGDCIGELILNANGTFERHGFSPGNNTASSAALRGSTR